METLVLDVQVRDLKINPKNLRKQSIIPAVCYGQGKAPMAVQVPYSQFRQIYRKAGTSQVVNLKVEGKELPVLIHDLAFDAMTDEFRHIDFLEVNLKKKVEATVPVLLEGVSPAVKNFGGLVTHVKHDLDVYCLPMDIPHEVVIDLSKLENIGDAVAVKDLKLGEKVEILTDAEEVIVTISAPQEFTEQSAEVPDELKTEPVAAEGDKKEEEKKED